MLHFVLVFVLQISFAYCESGDDELYVIIGSAIGSFVIGLILGCISALCIAYCVYRGLGIGHKVQLSVDRDPDNVTMTIENNINSSPTSTVVRYVRDNSGSNNFDERDVSSSFTATLDSDAPAPKKPLPPPVGLKPSKGPVLHLKPPSNSSDDISEYDLPIVKSKSLQRGLVRVAEPKPIKQLEIPIVRRSFSLNELKTLGLATEHPFCGSDQQYGSSPPSEHYYTAELPKPPSEYMNIGPRKAE